jgi:hypothetical protein
LDIQGSSERLAQKEMFIGSRLNCEGKSRTEIKKRDSDWHERESSIMEVKERIDSLEFALETEELQQ